MSDSFSLTGSIATTPGSGSPSLSLEVAYALNEVLQLSEMQPGTYELNTDPAVDVNLGGLSEVNVLVIKSQGGRVRVSLTSTDGSNQVISADTVLINISQSVGYTAIRIQRDAGVQTKVQVFLGQI